MGWAFVSSTCFAFGFVGSIIFRLLLSLSLSFPPSLRAFCLGFFAFWHPFWHINLFTHARTLWHWFSVTLLPRWEGRRWNGMVKGPKTWRCFNIEVSHLQRCDDDARGRRGKGFRGSSMNHHGNKQRKSGVTACTTVRQVRPPSGLFVGHPPLGRGMAPAEVGWEPFVQGWTHANRRFRRFFKERWDAYGAASRRVWVKKT